MSNAVAPRQDFGVMLQAQRGAIEAALPKHMTADRMLRVCLTEFRTNTFLQTCEPKSILASIVKASQLGLEPGSALGHAYLVPYKGVCQLVIGYRGMVALARRSGEIKSIDVRAVFDGDKFKVTLGMNPNVEHEPSDNNQEWGNLTHVYAVAKLMGGGEQFDYMTRAEVEAIRKASPSIGKTSSPWNAYPVEMAKKTVVRRLFKMLPVSIEMARAIEHDNAIDTVATVTESPRQRTDALLASLAASGDTLGEGGELFASPEDVPAGVKN